MADNNGVRREYQRMRYHELMVQALLSLAECALEHGPGCASGMMVERIKETRI